MFVRTRLTTILSFGFAAGITLFPFVLISPQARLTRRLVVHERIHLRQQKELLLILFYLLYLLEYFWKLVKYRDHRRAYLYISFEREAYDNDKNLDYLTSRKPFSWRKYL